MTVLPADHWRIACLSSEVRRSPRAIVIDRLPLVLFRDQHRKIAALEDRCAHRNAPLSQGLVCAGRLQCPYHGWEYDGEGSVVNVPALSAENACPQTLRIKRFHTRESEGFVWVSLAPENPHSPPPLFANFGSNGWTSFVMKTRFRATIDACLENFLDCPHATFVHRYWFRAPTAKTVKAVVTNLDDGVVAEFFDEPREKSAVWWLLSPKRGSMRHTDRFIAPATSRVDYDFPGGLSYIITSSCTEIDENETEVFTVISFRYGRLGFLVRLFFEPLSRLIIRQDARMLAAQSANIRRFGKPQFNHTDADLLGPTISAWRRACKLGSEPPPSGVQKTVEIRL